jgi:ribosomal protein S12 methylthiotransferase accessory factor
MRPYKVVDPSTTIRRIRSLLEEHGIEVKPVTEVASATRLYSCRYCLNDIASLAQNGKGISPDAAMASALAEIMERLQNLILFAGKVGLNKSELIRSFPDVELRTSEDCPDGHPVRLDFVRRELPSAPSNQSCGRFYDVRHNEVILLPYAGMLHVTGSNGMCAGNTPAEALLQGICEIVERWALKNVYSEATTPATIALASIPEGIAQDIVCQLDSLGFTVILKDCSFGIGIPVIGAIILNRASGRYLMSIGVHSIAEYALQRALTESFQGRTADQITEVGHPFRLGRDEFGDGETRFRRLASEFAGQFIGKKGRLPFGLLDHNPQLEMTQWTAFDASPDYETDARIIAGLLLSAGYEIYIRDVSFLGFPSYFIYIPGMSPAGLGAYGVSEQFKSLCSLRDSAASGHRKTWDNLLGSSHQQVRDLIDFIELHRSCFELPDEYRDNAWLTALYGFKLENSNLPVEYILALLHSHLGEFDVAWRQMDSLFDHKAYERGKEIHLFCMRDWFYLRSEGLNDQEAANWLSSIYPVETVAVIEAMMSDRRRLSKALQTESIRPHADYPRCCALFQSVRKSAQAFQPDYTSLQQIFGVLPIEHERRRAL